MTRTLSYCSAICAAVSVLFLGLAFSCAEEDLESYEKAATYQGAKDKANRLQAEATLGKRKNPDEDKQPVLKPRILKAGFCKGRTCIWILGENLSRDSRVEIRKAFGGKKTKFSRKVAAYGNHEITYEKDIRLSKFPDRTFQSIVVELPDPDETGSLVDARGSSRATAHLKPAGDETEYIIPIPNKTPRTQLGKMAREAFDFAD